MGSLQHVGLFLVPYYTGGHQRHTDVVSNSPLQGSGKCKDLPASRLLVANPTATCRTVQLSNHQSHGFSWAVLVSRRFTYGNNSGRAFRNMLCTVRAEARGRLRGSVFFAEPIAEDPFGDSRSFVNQRPPFSAH